MEKEGNEGVITESSNGCSHVTCDELLLTISDLNFLSQVSYSFVNNPQQIIEERVMGHVPLPGKRFLFCFLSFNVVGKVKSWTVYDNLFGFGHG